ncbi:agmatinase [Marinicella meishanensis]|uniref:agmatinase n=1 Tax=Marinicella meishanensis TaxID=2873263 RepID=UPI001CBF0148|nr:agmatinase [Marinicella sp. NBU2979]
MGDWFGGRAMPQHSTALIGVPSDENSSFLTGCAQAPQRIRQALHSDSANLWSERGHEVRLGDNCHDLGDLPVTGDAAGFAQVTQAVDQCLQAGNRVLSLGGDHAVTFPLVRAFAPHYADLTLLHFDAHTDLYDDFQDNPLSHASPFARIMEKQLAKRLIQVGIRTLNDHQRDQVKRFGVEVYGVNQCAEVVALGLTGPVYVSVDLDALDPAFAPGVSHHEPGGLSTRELIQVLHSIQGPVVGADIVEYNPTRDIHDMTAMVAAKLLREMLALMAL